ncbi:MAG: hypothetical protein KME12_25135 [Trichocoleus desertorum ATA4-8-CV12]|jgi:hypothetical protein|nr:hypothetical protein [Trichocoleus desertorum ATA4-8-CV12]
MDASKLAAFYSTEIHGVLVPPNHKLGIAGINAGISIEQNAIKKRFGICIPSADIQEKA